MKKVSIVTVTLVLLMLLTACGNNTSKNSKSNKSTQNEEVIKSKWDSKKNKQLEAYMKDFSKVINQEYVEYKDHEKFDFKGKDIPNYIKKKSEISVNKKTKKIFLTLTKSKIDKKKMNIVSIYKSDNHGYLYLFVIEEGKPQVFVNQNNQQEKKLLKFEKTENKELLKAFENIYNGKPYTKLPEPKNNNDSQNSSPKSLIPDNMQGIWYGYNEYTNSIETITMRGNTITTTGKYGGSMTVHADSERTADEKRYFTESMDPNLMIESRKSWALIQSVNDKIRGANWVNVKGWYQTAGVGTYYAVYNRDGNQVLTEAMGADVWVNMHYYRTEALANQMKNKRYPGEEASE